MFLIAFVDWKDAAVFHVMDDRVPGVGELCDFREDGLWRVKAVLSMYNKHPERKEWRNAKCYHLSVERVVTEATPPEKKKEN